MDITHVLIANRGEIAVRIAATLAAMGIGSTTVYTDADAQAAHVCAGDDAVSLGSDARGYLDIEAILSAARQVGADAIHPGYGFLSENADFAGACAEAGLIFIGPSPQAIETMGDKIRAKATAEAAGVAVVPGRYRAGMTDDDVADAVLEVGRPALLKPAAGGGGKGMRVVADGDDLQDAIAAARREARASFGDDTLMVERYVSAPRHIEVQVLGDSHGNVRHVFTRECSLQRRHQKVVEEAPALLPDAVMARILADAVAVAGAVEYVGAGTVEFILDGADPDSYYFLEMNTRLQVEHPVTEMVTGEDLVAQQIDLARGASLAEFAPRVSGHAVEARLYAEDPASGFLPTGGRIAEMAIPDGPGIRVDAGVTVGSLVTSDYDPMIAKVIAHGRTRPESLAMLRRGLVEMSVLGVTTNQAFLLSILGHPDVAANTISTSWIEQNPQLARRGPIPEHVLVAAAMERLLHLHSGAEGADPWDTPTGWRLGEPAWAGWRLMSGTSTHDVFLRGTPSDAEVRINEGIAQLDGAGESFRCSGSVQGDTLSVTYRDRRRSYRCVAEGERRWLGYDGQSWAVDEVPRLRAEQGPDASTGLQPLRSPMPGTVIDVAAIEGQPTVEGQTLVTVEAMKMEHSLTAPAAATVAAVLVGVGDRVALEQELVRFADSEEE